MTRTTRAGSLGVLVRKRIASKQLQLRIAAGITALQQHRHSLAVSALQSAGSRIITTRKEALVRYLSKHHIFKQLPSDAELSTLFNL